MNLKATPLLVLIFAIRLIAAGPVSSGESDVMPGRKRAPKLPKYPYDPNRTSREGPQGPFYFEQQVEHLISNPGNYTFNQRYWVNDKYFIRNYESPNPIFLYISDQKEGINKELLRQDSSMFLHMAKITFGMLVILEHRYFGESYPVDGNLSEENMQYLTTAQVLRDVESFAMNGMDHMDLRARSVPAPRYRTKSVPWVLLGVGYTGGLVHWAMMPQRSSVNVFWAGYSSSGMVQAKEDLWEYWDETSRIMPPGCAKDVAKVVKYFDDVYYSDLEKKKKESTKRLGRELGLTQIKHADDMAKILSHAIDYGSDPERVDTFCDALESDEDGNILEDGEERGLSWALEAWRNYNKKTYSNDSDLKWSSHDMTKSKYTDLKPRAVSSRVTQWSRCNEFGWFKVAPDPKKVSTVVVSQLLDVNRERSICKQVFPRSYNGSKSAPSTDVINKYGGHSKKPATRVFYVNGGLDPNLSLTLADINADNVETVRNATNNKDIDLSNENPAIKKVVDKAVEPIRVWLHEWWEATSSQDSDSDDASEEFSILAVSDSDSEDDDSDSGSEDDDDDSGSEDDDDRHGSAQEDD